MTFVLVLLLAVVGIVMLVVPLNFFIMAGGLFVFIDNGVSVRFPIASILCSHVTSVATELYVLIRVTPYLVSEDILA